MAVEYILEKEGELYVEDLPCDYIARKFETPVFVHSQSRITDNYRDLYHALSRVYGKVRILCPAGLTLSVLRVLEREGAYLSCSSVDEAFLALKGGFLPERLIFTGSFVRDSEFDFLRRNRIVIGMDSTYPLIRMSRVSSVPPVVCAAAGEDAVGFCRLAKSLGAKQFAIRGDSTNWVASSATDVRRELDIRPEFLCIRVFPEGNIFSWAEQFAGHLKDRLKDADIGTPYLFAETGDYITRGAGLLLASVYSSGNGTVRTDAELRDGRVVSCKKAGAPAEEKYDVFGTAGIGIKGAALPKTEQGGLLAFYNQVPARNCREVLAHSGRVELVRERETSADVLQRQHIASWLR